MKLVESGKEKRRKEMRRSKARKREEKEVKKIEG